MSGISTSSTKFPAGKTLAAFIAGCVFSGICMAALAYLMIKLELSQSATWPLATGTVSAGSLLSGWLMAFWQKNRGLLCGVVQGSLFVFLLLLFVLMSGSLPEELQLIRFSITFLFGCMGGVLGMFRSEKCRHI